MTSAIVDAGPVIALFDKSDQYHNTALEFLRNFKGRLFSTWPAITEVLYVLDFSIQNQVNCVEWIAKGGITLVDLKAEDLVAINELMVQYKNIPMDFADASIMAMANRYNLSSIVSFDAHFNVYRTASKKLLRNLIRPRIQKK